MQQDDRDTVRVRSDPTPSGPHAFTTAFRAFALRTLAGMPNTHVAVISGRALRDLAELSELPDEVHLVGSHGSEFDRDFHRSLEPALVQLKKDLRTQLEQIAATDPGLLIEDKPASLALHYRNARPESEKKVLDAILRGPGSLAQVNVRHGKKVVELMLLPTHKGDALERIRARVGASAVLFLGDDRTDEGLVVRSEDASVEHRASR